MQLTYTFRNSVIFSICITAIATLFLAGCGGGGGSGSSTVSPSQIAAISPAQIATYTDAQIIAFGTDIQYLSNAALAALSGAVGPGHPAGQIQSITAAEIAALSPAQVRMIGAAGLGGSTTTSQIVLLNSGTWDALASDPAQVAAITPAEIQTLYDIKITAIGANFKYLSNAALAELSPTIGPGHPTGQIYAISVTAIAGLTPAQVRLIGAAGPGGAITTSQIRYLNSGTWSTLVSDPAQVAAITPAEVFGLAQDGITEAGLSLAEIKALGTNISYLNDAALGALSAKNCLGLCDSQISSITAVEIAALTPAQVRMIGSTGVGGATTTSQISSLNSGTWTTLISDPAQVAAITHAEVATLTYKSQVSTPTFDQISALGTNMSYLSDAALGGFSTANCIGLCLSQLYSITATEIAVLNPAQVGIIAGLTTEWGIGTSITRLNLGTFGSLVAAQVAILTPTNVLGVTAAQLASLTESAIAGFAPATIASFTVTQKSLLSTAQHTACGC